MESGDRYDKRARILAAALTAFGRRGVAKTRIADIASEAGIAYGLVYHYFKNKDEILHTIFEERWATIAERLEEVEKSRGNARERLQGAAEGFIGVCRAHPQVVELVVLELFSSPVRFESAGAAMIADMFMNGVGTR